MFSIAKFFGGFAFWRGDKFGKILFQLIIIALCLWLFYAKFIAKDAPVTKADKIEYNTSTRGHLIEVQLGIFKLGLL